MIKSLALVVLVGSVMPLAGCAAQLGDDGGDAFEPDPALSPIGKHVVSALHEQHASGDGRTWGLAVDDSFAPGWVVQTPLAEYWGQPASALPIATDCGGDPKCDPNFRLIRCATQSDCTFGGRCTEVAATVTTPGASPQKLCTGHSDAFYDDIYNVIAGAQNFVDIASLEAPDGRFEAAVRNAFTLLSRTGRPIRVRLLYGAVPTRAREPAEVLGTLTRDVGTGSQLRVGVGMYRANLVSWNHTKLIGADGRIAIVGGHNMWTQHYLQQSPVHDLSMRVTGSAAADASTFANELWRLTCHPPSAFGSVGEVVDFPAGAKACGDDFDVTDAIAFGTGHVPVITVGKLGGIDGDEGQDAIIALIGAAKTNLKLSLQDIGPVGGSGAWPEPYLHAIAAALARGVEVELVLTNLNALPGGLNIGSASYSNGWTPLDVAKQLVEHAAAYPELGAMRDLVCNKLHATTLRQGPDDLWPDGRGLANHAKLVIADDAAFYLGSQNMYPAQLSELGYIVDDVSVTRELLDTYFTKMWQASARAMTNTCL